MTLKHAELRKVNVSKSNILTPPSKILVVKVCLKV